jgi:hypothetical protein
MTLAYAEAVYRHPDKLSNVETSVLACLALMADPDGHCWPRQGTIADRVRLHPDTVKKVLVELAARGFIRKVRRSRDDGSQTSNMMELCFPAADLRTEKRGCAPPTPGSTTPVSENRLGVLRPPGGVITPGAPGVDDPPHESSGEESEENPPAPKGVSADILKRSREILAETPRKAKRCSVAVLAKHLSAAVKRKANPDAIALRAYYLDEDNAREEGRYCKDPAKMVSGDLWRDWIPEDGDEPAAAAPKVQLTEEQMAAHLTRVWTVRVEDYLRINAWNDQRYGARPGQPGCVVPAHVLAQFEGRL